MLINNLKYILIFLIFLLLILIIFPSYFNVRDVNYKLLNYVYSREKGANNYYNINHLYLVTKLLI